MKTARTRTPEVSAAPSKPQARIIPFTPRPKPDPRDDKYRAAAIDRSKTIVVEAWLLDALLRHHQIMDDFLCLMQQTSFPATKGAN